MIAKFPDSGYKDIFYNSQAAMLIINPDAPLYTIIDVNPAYLSATNATREVLMGQSVFGAFPANPTDEESKNIERTVFSFEQAINTKKPHTMSNYRYDIPIRGTDKFEERYWTTTNTPVLDENEEVIYFIHSPVNVTELYKLTEKEKAGVEALKKQRQQLYSTFMQAPVGIAILKGPEYIVDLINPPLCELYGKTIDEMMGKPIFQALSHAKGLGFEGLLDNVRLTGESYKGSSLAIPIVRNEKLETVYVNFVYEPFHEGDGTISGVIVVATEITEQVSAKNLAKEADERARLAVDAVGLGTFDLDLLTGEMLTSPLVANIFGFDEPVPRGVYVDSFHPDDLVVRKKALRDAVSKGRLSFEARVVWKDKSVHWVRIEGKTFYNSDSVPERILGTVLDITDQRKAKEEQRKLITLVDNSVDLMAILNMDGTNSYLNEAGRNLLGFENEEEISNIPISQLYAPEYFDLIEKEVIPTIMSKGKWAGTTRVKHLKTGEILPVFNNSIRIDDPVSGEPIAVGAVMRDLRSEQAAKKALADNEHFLRNITNATPTALWVSDENGLINYVNKTWIDWTGRSYEENMGLGWLEAIIPDDKARAKEVWMSNFVTQKFLEIEFRINHSDGTIHWCVANGEPQYHDDGSFYGYIGACIDVTEQKHLQRQKDDFIGIASHELKTPVTSIKAYTQVLERILKKNGNTREAEMVGKMDLQINRLTSLISDLLDVTKINSGRLQFNDQEFDFNLMVKELVEELQRTSQKHTLVENYSSTGIVFGDKERIGQVIVNLINNAIKYSPQSDKIIIHTKLQNKEVMLCVEDFGIGISPNNLERVFEQFYRVSGDIQHTFPGLGLGLYISSEIIKREGGRIWVNSIEGSGSTFCFSLPLQKQNK